MDNMQLYFNATDKMEFWEKMIDFQVGEMGIGDDEIGILLKSLFKNICMKNIKRILAVAESPIEKKFLASMAFGFFRYDPCCLYVPAHDEPAVLKQAYEDKKILDKNPNENIDEYRKSCAIILPMLYEKFEIDKGVWLLPQFPLKILAEYDKKYNSLKRMRVDALLLDKTTNKVLVIECDGYEWHKNNFTADRERDRKLRLCGVDVMRFSGAEINNDPIATSHQIFEYVIKNFKSKFFKSLKRKKG